MISKIACDLSHTAITHHSADNTATPPPTERVPLSNEKRAVETALLECHGVTDYRTFVEDYIKVVEFVDWLKENHPEKSKFITEKF